MPFRNLSVILALFLLCSCFSENVFHSATETPIADPDPTLPAIAQLIFDEEADDQASLLNCLSDFGFERSQLHLLFISKKLDLDDDDNPEYFVRPALEPYCHAFYGAHLFRYWFVEQKHSTFVTLYRSGGDSVTVLSSSTNGYRDLREASHTAVENYIRTSRFTLSSGYEVFDCEIEHFEEGKIVRKTPCSDF